MTDLVTLVAGLDEDGSALELLPGKVATFEFGFGADFHLHSVGLLPHEAERVSIVVSFSDMEVRWTVFMDGARDVVVAKLLRQGEIVKFAMENHSTETVLRRACLRGWWATP